jgi:hypothetical protein
MAYDRGVGATKAEKVNCGIWYCLLFVRTSSNATCLCRNACISDKEVDGDEGNEDDTAVDDTNSSAANDAAPNNDSYATMLSKFKAPPRKPG